MKNGPIEGIRVDLDELKKTSTLTLWGRVVRKDMTLSPYMKLHETFIDLTKLMGGDDFMICDTLITFE